MGFSGDVWALVFLALVLRVPLLILVVWLSRVMRFSGNWILYTASVLLFSVGMLIQYRLYSDPEYNARNKSAARQEKMEALRTRYIIENYDPVKKQMMGLPPTPAQARSAPASPKPPSPASATRYWRWTVASARQP